MGDPESPAKQSFAPVSAGADDPEARYGLRVRFYEKYGEAIDDGAGYGNSELAFMRWEIDRGVLEPLDAPRPGSRWWRNVNASLLFDAELAALIYESGAQDTSTAAPSGSRRQLLGRGDSILALAVRIFDDALIMPEATSVYGHAAQSLGIPELTALVRDGKPRYPTL